MVRRTWAFLLRCDKDFTPVCIQRDNLILSNPVQCYTVGTHFRCLGLRNSHLERLRGFFSTWSKSFIQIGDPKRRKIKKRSYSFTAKWPLLGETRIDGARRTTGDFLTTPPRTVANSNPGSTHAGDKWQGYLPGNYKFYWSQIWDPFRVGKETAFIWSIWHKAIAVNEWRARITPTSLSKQCVFCLPHTSEFVEHKFWDCIQARRAWRWATCIMDELCGVRTKNYDNFIWKQTMFGERIPKKFGMMIKIWHLLRGITLWIIWIEGNDKVFNHEE